MRKSILSFRRAAPVWFGSALMLSVALSGCREVLDPEPTALSADEPGIAPSFTLSVGGTETPITTETADQGWPVISGDTIVWNDARNGQVDIYMYDLSTKTETRITTGAADEYIPQISGDKIVWHEGAWGNLDIFVHDLSTSTTKQITPDAGDQVWVNISGDRIV